MATTGPYINTAEANAIAQQVSNSRDGAIKDYVDQKAATSVKGVVTPASNPVSPVNGDAWAVSKDNLDQVFPNFGGLTAYSTVNGAKCFKYNTFKANAT